MNLNYLMDTLKNVNKQLSQPGDLLPSWAATRLSYVEARSYCLRIKRRTEVFSIVSIVLVAVLGHDVTQTVLEVSEGFGRWNG